MYIGKLRHKSVSKFVTTILFLAFLFQIVNKSVYTHAHVLADGTVIVHAHPYNATNESRSGTNHTHSENELLLLNLPGLLFSSFVIAFGIYFRNYVERVPSLNNLFLPCLAHNTLKNKAPPFYFSPF